MIADAGYDSDPLRERLKKRAIELITSCRKINKRRRYEEGRKLRRGSEVKFPLGRLKRIRGDFSKRWD